MDLHPDIPAAAAYVRQVYELGVRYFDCARMYWNGQSEEAYGLGLQGIRKDVFLTSKSAGRTAKDAVKDLETSLRLLKTDHVDLWQMHAIQGREDIEAVLKPGGAEARHRRPGGLHRTRAGVLEEEGLTRPAGPQHSTASKPVGA